jgi:type II secretory pathway pseudopilin PulG
MTRNSLSRKPAGFTRIDLLILLLLVVLGGGVAVASVARVRGAADRAVSKNNLHQFARDIQGFADEHQGYVPTARGNFFPARLTPRPGTTVSYGPCLFHLLPHIEEDRLYSSSLLTVGEIKVYASWELAGKSVKPFVAPGDPTADPASDRTSYLVNGWAFFHRGNARLPASFPDGLSNTIFFSEGYSQAVDPFSGSDPSKLRLVDRRWWDDPTWTPMPTSAAFQVAPPTQGASVLLPQGFDPAGIQVAMGDASVRMVSPKCSATTFYHASTPNGGEILGEDW